jgi:N-acetylneuraminate synthase/pseudaminic acid synthase
MINKTVIIDNIKIGKKYPPYIIAELSANHANDLNIAIKSIKEAKKAGATAVKLQTYTADTLTLDCKKKEFLAKGAWEGQYLYDLYKNASMPWEWTKTLQEVAKETGITLFSSPFDFSAVDFLEKLNIPAYKIASPEIIDLPLIKYIAKTQKPIILSTGGATLSQIDNAIQTILQEGNKNIIILKCTSEYPAPYEKINLKSIKYLQKLYKCPVGLSDHTLGISIPIASIAIGANVIEKHFILDKDIKTADSFFSASPQELKEIVDGANAVFKAIGKVDFPKIEQKPQRSLIVVKDIKKNERLVINKNIKSLRPGGKIEPKYIDIINNKKVKKDLKYGSFLDWDDLL